MLWNTTLLLYSFCFQVQTKSYVDLQYDRLLLRYEIEKEKKLRYH